MRKLNDNHTERRLSGFLKEADIYTIFTYIFLLFAIQNVVYL